MTSKNHPLGGGGATAAPCRSLVAGAPIALKIFGHPKMADRPGTLSEKMFLFFFSWFCLRRLLIFELTSFQFSGDVFLCSTHLWQIQVPITGPLAALNNPVWWNYWRRMVNPPVWFFGTLLLYRIPTAPNALENSLWIPTSAVRRGIACVAKSPGGAD